MIVTVIRSVVPVVTKLLAASVSVSLTDDEKAAVQRKAKAAGVSQSAFCRAAILKALGGV